MRIGIIGNGVVGNATALAFEGHADEVRRYDIVDARRTHSLGDTLDCDLVFVCLPTPRLRSSLNLDTNIISDLFDAIRREGTWKNANLVLRSTVPIGYTKMMRQAGLVNLVHSPEFLTARTAVENAANPTRLIIGSPTDEYTDCEIDLHQLYQRRWPTINVMRLTSDESEMVKLMQNAFSAVKVAFFNEARSLSDKLCTDWDRVMTALLAGGWINSMHTQVPGPDGKRGFGGSCLPKDLACFIQHLYDAGVCPTRMSVCNAARVRNNLDRKENG